MPRRRSLAVPLALVVVAYLPYWADAQVRRCTAPDGSLVFTDRACDDVGATERAPSALSPQGNAYRGGCSRTLQILIDNMRYAIDNRDVNQLAALYHWTGVSNRSSQGLMNRLDTIAQRPLVDIAILRPARTIIVGTENGWMAGYGTDAIPLAVTRRVAPNGVRVEQTTGDGATPARTIFSLKQHLGCWWVQF